MSTLPQDCDVIDDINLVASTEGPSVNLIACSLSLHETPLFVYTPVTSSRSRLSSSTLTIASYIKHLMILTVSPCREYLIQKSSLPSVTEIISPLQIKIAITHLDRHLSPLQFIDRLGLCLEDVRNVPLTLFSICINLASITFKIFELQPSSLLTQETLSEVVQLVNCPDHDFWHLKFQKKSSRTTSPSPSIPLVDLNGLRSLMIVNQG